MHVCLLYRIWDLICLICELSTRNRQFKHTNISNYRPSATLDEEVFYLTLIDWRALKSRLHMAHLLLTIENCNHLQHTCLHVCFITHLLPFFN